jgi:hypothetical protein
LPNYFPFSCGRYEVKPGLFRFGKPLGGGRADNHVFQLDEAFAHYRERKLASRAERLTKYFQTHLLSRDVEAAVAEFIVRRLTLEHPDLFRLEGRTMACALTGECLTFDSGGAVDTLACEIQEDLAVVSFSEDASRHWLSAAHVCLPNGWSPEEKIGRSFAAIHEPVAEMQDMKRRGDQLAVAMLAATDGLVRFAWGVTFDDELNHHPDPPAGLRRLTAFDPENPCAFVRAERQTIWGLRRVNAALFTIRTYLYDCATIPHRQELAAAIESMTPASLAYKGLTASRDALLRWLRA